NAMPSTLRHAVTPIRFGLSGGDELRQCEVERCRLREELARRRTVALLDALHGRQGQACVGVDDGRLGESPPCTLGADLAAQCELEGRHGTLICCHVPQSNADLTRYVPEVTGARLAATCHV